MQDQITNNETLLMADGEPLPISFIGVSQMSGQLTIDLVREFEKSAEIYESAFSNPVKTENITYVNIRGEKVVYTGYTALAYMAISYYHDFYSDGLVRIMLAKN